MIQLTWFTCYAQPSSSWPDFDVHAFKVKPCTFGILYTGSFGYQMSQEDNKCCTARWLLDWDHTRWFLSNFELEEKCYNCFQNSAEYVNASVVSHIMLHFSYSLPAWQHCMHFCNAENTTVDFSLLLYIQAQCECQLLYRKLIAVYLSLWFELAVLEDLRL